MVQSTRLLLLLATLPVAPRRPNDEPIVLPPGLTPEEERIALDFLSVLVTPQSTFDLERRLAEHSREHTRLLVQAVLNIAAAQSDAAADRVRFDGDDYRRLHEATHNRHVATRFGTITLVRHMFRAGNKDSGLSCISPAEMAMGLMQSATPALAESATRYFAESGATQESVLARLKEQHGVAMGAARLRRLAAERAAALAESRVERLADQLVGWLKQAFASTGRHKPALSVGRDGVTLREYRHRFFEVASVGTLAVFDRRGKRLGTVYLGCVPESNQPTMNARLTELIQAVCRRWTGPTPRWCYVTDAGDNETGYYERVLKSMRHPVTGGVMEWTRVLDFYHAMERVWTMAKALFGRDECGGAAWARRMGKLLKKPNGAFRMLHAAAALRHRTGLSATRSEDYRKAYAYIRQRTKWMKYAEYSRVGVPLASGVTEAACRTLVAQRLKLSGMRWKKAGAQWVLDLRAELLSGTWHAANQRLQASRPQPEPRPTPTRESAPTAKKAA